MYSLYITAKVCLTILNLMYLYYQQTKVELIMTFAMLRDGIIKKLCDIVKVSNLVSKQDIDQG